ncbi:phage tail sheath family protein [filamentous cyanobacterium Phorm 6]|nr:phage tail sheath family protein [filamentous cyanobacterium Phorm 6]
MPNYSSPGVYVEEVSSGSAPISGVGTSTAGFIGVINTPGTSSTELDATLQGSQDTLQSDPGTKAKDTLQSGPGTKAKDTLQSGRGTTTLSPIPPQSNQPNQEAQNKLAEPNVVKLCTNFSEFEKLFGSLSSSDPQKQKTKTPLLAHAVYGFFRNGGTRCYVVQVNGDTDINNALEKFEAIDEIAIVAAPGCNISLGQMIVEHCKKMRDRFAILDCKEDADHTNILDSTNKPPDSEYGAFYFPWIQVFNPEDSKKEKYVPPSGHLAGIYARVDAQRGVHKAPANEIVLGALGLKQNLSKSQQDGLNPKGINCIRNLNGNIRVWGARTIGGEDNGEFKYINVRRLFNYLKKSIDQGTQWTVFEPNSPELWAKIRRNVTSFLMTVWRSGALFGNTPEQAFYVKCDEETNPPELREQGQVVTEIGVAIVKPAEFVIFNLSQWAGPGK